MMRGLPRHSSCSSPILPSERDIDTHGYPSAKGFQEAWPHTRMDTGMRMPILPPAVEVRSNECLDQPGA